MPASLHDWRQFIKPSELVACLARHGLQNRHNTGLTPAIKPSALFWLLRQRKRGLISYAELGRRSQLGLSRDLPTIYLGYAIKPA
jgi:2-polyprenyl-6-hydroxyphenyl methylase/3-demethylubiquinone-9 3-methyltransferase